MNTMTRIIVIIVVALVASIGGYFYGIENNKNVLIDNPGNTEITVTLDGTEHKIPTLGSVTTKISYGKHTLVLNGQSVGEFEHVKPTFVDAFMKIASKASLVNPTKATYYIETIMYGGSGTNMMEDKVVTDIYVPATWDYTIGETSPDTITTKSRGNSAIYKYHLWREADFAKYYDVSVEELRANFGL